MVHEPIKARLLRVAWKLSGRKPRVDTFLAGFLRYRNYLPQCDAADIIPDFETSEVRITTCPLGTWSSPLVDVFVVVKAALGFRSKRILELGSYRGHTAKLLAQNIGPDSMVCAVDVDERHGAAYRGTEWEKKIQRKTGAISRQLFGAEEKFDLIFVDANHDYDAVVNDTAVAFDVLAPGGVILWHDYAQDSYFHGMCGVPEALNEVSKERALYAIRGTRLAIYSTAPSHETASLQTRLSQGRTANTWEEEQVRG